MQKKKRVISSKTKFVMACLIPILGFYSLFFIFPISNAFNLSLRIYNLAMPKHPFIGLGNFRALFSDRIFLISLRNTFKLVGLIVPTTIILGLLVAIGINSELIKQKSFFRVAYFIPSISMSAAIAYVWMFIYQPSGGILNIFLKSIGFSKKNFLGDFSLVLPSLALVGIWQGVGFNVILFLAGLQAIPDIYYEAATIDGAGKWKLFWHITLPLLLPSFLFVSVTTTIQAFQLFTTVFIMTGGGPANSSTVIVLQLYREAFRSLRMGYAATIGVFLLGIIFIFSLLQLKVLQKKWEY